MYWIRLLEGSCLRGLFYVNCRVHKVNQVNLPRIRIGQKQIFLTKESFQTWKGSEALVNRYCAFPLNYCISFIVNIIKILGTFLNFEVLPRNLGPQDPNVLWTVVKLVMLCTWSQSWKIYLSKVRHKVGLIQIFSKNELPYRGSSFRSPQIRTG